MRGIRKLDIFSIKALLIVTTCLTLFMAPGAEARSRTPTPTPAPTTTPVVKAITANAFLDSLGVNTHFDNNWQTDAYSNVTIMESELRYIGIRYARDNIMLPSTLATVQKVHQDIGTKFDILVGTDLATQITELQANTSLIEEVEGPNEIDIWPVTYNGVTGPSAAVAFQTALYTKMKGTASLKSFAVNNLTIADGTYIPSVGNLSVVCDYSGSHIYPQFGGNATPTGNIEWSASSNSAFAPGKPAVITEFGWWTQPMGAGVPLDVQAKYTLNFFLDAYTYGVHRSYLYELNDEYADPTGTSIEYHFGLFQSNGAAKPAATAMNIMTTLLADPTPLAAPSGLALTISKASNTPVIKSLLMQRGDGVFILALWQDPLIWDTIAQQKVSVPAEQALVNFGITAKSVQLYDPLVGTTAAASYTNVGGITQMVPDHPIFLFIKQ